MIKKQDILDEELSKEHLLYGRNKKKKNKLLYFKI